MINSFFYTKPMDYNYVISTILDIVNLFFLIYIFSDMEKKIYFIIAHIAI